MEEYENKENIEGFNQEESGLKSYPEEGQPESSEEEYEYEEYEANETEFSLTDDEINEWINELVRLRDEGVSVELDIDEENSLKINYEESSDEEDSESFDSESGDEDSEQGLEEDGRQQEN